MWWPGVLTGGDDRLFATALMTNTLIDVWTHRTDGSTPLLVWDRSTPDEVVKAVHQAMRWSQDTIDSEPYPWLNACFSGSVKGVNTLPFFFPTNTVETHGAQGFHGVRGRISETEYAGKLERCQARLRDGRLGERSSAFTHWCSPTLTRAVTMLAMAKAGRLEDRKNPPSEATSL